MTAAGRINLRNELGRFIVPGLEETGVSLGTGSYGEVVKMILNGETVAVKKIHTILLGARNSQYMLEKFEDECIRLSSVKHSNIVAFLGIYFEDNSDVPMLVMEYLPRSLNQFVDGNVPKEDTRTSILLDIAQGLKYLHGLDPPLIHRDLTSNNVLLTNDMKAKISDLGTSKFLKQEARNQTMTNVPGNESHMPPEARVLNADKYTQPADKATKLDIFSFGNIIINMLTGEFPIADSDRDESGRRRNEVQRRRKQLDKIPESKEKDLIVRCLNINPDHRPSSDELVDIFKGLPTVDDNLNDGEIIFVDPPTYDVKCPICLEVFEDAQQTACCGNHVCFECSRELKTKHDACPFCRKPDFGATPDKFFSRQLLSLQVECYNSPRGCLWTGDLRDLKKHVEETCRKNFLKCTHCSLEMPRKDYPEHVHVCVETPQRCPNQCPARSVKRKDLKQHLEQACPLRVIRRGPVSHAANQLTRVAPLAVTMTNYSQHLKTGDTWYSPPFYTHKNGYKVHLRVDANLHKKGFLSVLVCVLKGEHDHALNWPLYADVKIALYNWRTNKPLYTKVLHLPGDAFCTINTSDLPLPWGKGDIQFISHRVLASDLAKNKEYIRHDSLCFQVKGVTILKAPTIPRLPPWANDNCIVVPSFSSFKQNEKFYGPPMYTHRGGYKFCPRVDPKGSGSGRGSHVSIFCTVMKGEHDDTLGWPVEADVVVKMLNWREDKNHRSHTICFNEACGSKVTSRVIGDALAELSFGSPKFVAHSSLSHNVTTNTQYLNADCLLFKVGPVSAFLDKVSSAKLPAWINPAMGSPYPCVTLPDFTKRKGIGNKFFGIPFYSHRNGYKMQLRVSTAIGQNIGLHVYLMQGPNDDHLQWPFCGDVNVELVNWRGDNGHHSKVISLSSKCTNTVCDRVTTGDRGCDSWGHDNFISHGSLPFNATTGTEYLQNDCLHFRVREIVVHSKPTLYNVPMWQSHLSRSPYFQFTVNNITGRNLLQNNFYSPAFYTHRNGYKMRLEVAIRKNQQGTQNLAVFARLLKGENDAMLSWPLCANIVVELLNWHHDGNHESYNIGYHERLSIDFNGRVQAGDSADNSWGTPSLLSCNSLAFNQSTGTAYVQDDCLCFRVKKVAAYSTSLAAKVPRWQARNQAASYTITDVAERAELDSVYYSPPFVASGYEMCLKVFVGGRGAQKGTHVSMYACILKGERDHALEWPFCGDIVVEVLNWRGDHGHYKNVLSLDSPELDSHARVMNDVVAPGGYGKSQFMPLSKLQQYLEDQCLRIRVSSVACYNTPLKSKVPRWQNRLNSSGLMEFNITGFSSRIANGNVFNSPPFYTHNQGYKMVLQVTAGESGEDRGNMSIYACLVAGEYDSSLRWPMNINLTVELLNWRANSAHVSKIIKFGEAGMSHRSRVPENSEDSPSFWGFGKFCSHTKLFGGSRNIEYVQDDCVRIRVKGAIIFSRKGLFGVKFL